MKGIGNNNRKLTIILLLYKLSCNGLNFFKDWVLKHHVFEIKEARHQTLIDIFEKVADQEIKVFVAMPFFDKDVVKSYNKAYERVIDKIKSENPALKLSLSPIMEHIEGSVNIYNKMIEQINECNIFIADISEANPNVAFELGYAKNDSSKSIIIVKCKGDETETPFDYAQDMHHEYNEEAIGTLEDIVYSNMKAILLKRGFTFNNTQNV